MQESPSAVPQPANPAPTFIEHPDSIARDVAAIANLGTVPKLLEILCNVTGMRFAAVARVSDESWTACAVRDDINFGLAPGAQLDLKSTLCYESRAQRASIFIDRASTDPRYCDHPTPRIYKIESYVSVPIIMPGGRYFGNLCAIDPAPANVSDPRTLAVFSGFAEMIGTQLEIELNREKDQNAWRDERAAGELRDQFLAILGHDLRNPLQAVSATATLLERRLADSALIGMASRIRSNVRRMSALIDDVLDFARGRLGGGIGVDIKNCADVESSLVSVVEELQDGCPERQIVLDATVTEPMRCDLGRVQQVLSNLIGNAISHGAADTPIKVNVRNTDDDLVLDVWNAGEPIPADSMGKIFQPFWRQSTSANRQGLGLGLHICSQIVRAHGGTLAVASTREDGTRFTVTLPLRPAIAQNSQRPG
jgi:signal transduction histidine kinase